MKYPYVYICQLCGGIAFYLKRKPEVYETIMSKDALLLDGTKPAHDSDVTCGNCDQKLQYMSVDQIKERMQA